MDAGALTASAQKVAAGCLGRLGFSWRPAALARRHGVLTAPLAPHPSFLSPSGGGGGGGGPQEGRPAVLLCAQHRRERGGHAGAGSRAGQCTVCCSLWLECKWKGDTAAGPSPACRQLPEGRVACAAPSDSDGAWAQRLQPAGCFTSPPTRPRAAPNPCAAQALSRADIAPALETLKKKLMERNVAEEIADK